MRRAWGLLVAGAAASCSLVVDLSGLSGSGNDASLDVAVLDAADASDGGACLFFDDFNRSSDAGIGNGWLTKQTGFVLANGAVQRSFANTDDYPDLIVYRPSSEDALDLIASVEVTYGIAPSGYPQLHARIQSATVGLPDTLDSYLLFPSGGSTNDMTIARNKGSSGYAPVGSFPLGTPLELGRTYRFTLGVQGTNPVALSASVERLDSATIWTAIGGITVNDTSTTRITFAGTVGFSASNADMTNQYSYDNFCRR